MVPKDKDPWPDPAASRRAAENRPLFAATEPPAFSLVTDFERCRETVNRMARKPVRRNSLSRGATIAMRGFPCRFARAGHSCPNVCVRDYSSGRQARSPDRRGQSMICTHAYGCDGGGGSTPSGSGAGARRSGRSAATSNQRVMLAKDNRGSPQISVRLGSCCCPGKLQILLAAGPRFELVKNPEYMRPLPNVEEDARRTLCHHNAVGESVGVPVGGVSLLSRSEAMGPLYAFAFCARLGE